MGSRPGQASVGRNIGGLLATDYLLALLVLRHQFRSLEASSILGQLRRSSHGGRHDQREVKVFVPPAYADS